MNGVDIERINATINDIKDEASTQIFNLCKASNYRLETINHTHNVIVESSDGAHGHGSGAHHHYFTLQGNNPTNGSGLVNHVTDQLTYPVEYKDDTHPTHKHIEHSIIYEREHIEMAVTYASTIIAMGVMLGDDVNKMEEIKNNMYTDVETFNNSYGSPWKEVNILKSKIDELEDYVVNHPILQWQSEKFALINILQIILSYAVDAKTSISSNQDYIQRGYDHQFNKDISSISWDDFEKGGTIGNRDQNTPGSVNLQRETDDPF